MKGGVGSPAPCVRLRHNNEHLCPSRKTQARARTAPEFLVPVTGGSAGTSVPGGGPKDKGFSESEETLSRREQLVVASIFLLPRYCTKYSVLLWLQVHGELTDARPPGSGHECSPQSSRRAAGVVILSLQMCSLEIKEVKGLIQGDD